MIVALNNCRLYAPNKVESDKDINIETDLTKVSVAASFHLDLSEPINKVVVKEKVGSSLLTRVYLSYEKSKFIVPLYTKVREKNKHISVNVMLRGLGKFVSDHSDLYDAFPVHEDRSVESLRNVMLDVMSYDEADIHADYSMTDYLLLMNSYYKDFFDINSTHMFAPYRCPNAIDLFKTVLCMLPDEGFNNIVSVINPFEYYRCFDKVTLASIRENVFNADKLNALDKVPDMTMISNPLNPSDFGYEIIADLNILGLEPLMHLIWSYDDDLILTYDSKTKHLEVKFGKDDFDSNYFSSAFKDYITDMDSISVYKTNRDEVFIKAKQGDNEFKYYLDLILYPILSGNYVSFYNY